MGAKSYELNKQDVLEAVKGRYADAEIRESHKRDTCYVSASTSGFAVNIYPEAKGLREMIVGVDFKKQL